MKKIRFIVLPVLILMSICVYSQHNFSLTAKAFMNDIKPLRDNTGSYRLNEHIIEKYALWQQHGTYYVSGLAKIANAAVVRDLELTGVLVNTVINDIASVRIPLEKIEETGKLSGVIYLELGRKVHPLLKDAVADTRADSVHAGINLPQAYTGKDVVIGFTDWGFDYTHPTFYDTSLTHLRLVRAWDQYKMSGPAPANYSYGTEFSQPSAFLAAGSDTFNIYGYNTHGTHVAGIAAGSGAGTAFRGLAFEAELVFVTIKVDEASVFDAFNYIYEYAQAAGKPLVINMSWGLYYIGALDGTSLLSQTLDYLSSQGVMLVSSAGNNGDVNFHIKKDFFTADTLRTFVGFQPYSAVPTMWGQSVSAWGSPGCSYSYTAEVYDNAGQKIAFLPFYNTDDNVIADTMLIIGTDTLLFRIESEASNPFNQRAGVRLRVRNLQTSQYKVAMCISADTGTVHLWNLIELVNDVGNWGTPFTGGIAGAVAGDAFYGVGEPACTERVLAVGAYRSQVILPNGNPAYGNISYFSSKGPLITGVVKPEITAPGQSVGSAMSSFYTTPFTSIASVDFGGKTYKFARLSGTSMSGPVVAGICALIREANPLLTPLQIKELVKETARQDNFTGVIPDSGSVVWGWGKINAYHACRMAAGLSNTPEKHIFEDNALLYPNPAGDFIRLYQLQGLRKVSVYSVNGQKIMDFQPEFPIINIAHLPNGLYLFEMAYDVDVRYQKVVVVK